MFVPVNFRAVALVGWLDDLQFYFLFNSISVITGQWTDDNGAVCNETLFMVGKILPQVGLEPGTARSVGQC